MRARSLAQMRKALGQGGDQGFSEELAAEVGRFVCGLPGMGSLGPRDLSMAGAYLAEELAGSVVKFVLSEDASALVEGLRERLREAGLLSGFERDLRSLDGEPSAKHQLASAWVDACVRRQAEGLAHAAPEATAWLVTSPGLWQVHKVGTSLYVEGLLGGHSRISDGRLSIRYDEFLDRLGRYHGSEAPAYRSYRALRRERVEASKRELRIGELKPRVLTSFVRNKLINDLYLHLIGDNLAKQMGASGDSKRTDLMGMLLLISPPGYGKTTLMEYVASRLGLAFVKVNGPSLGHQVVSLDPSEAPNATARQEVVKINLAFEMANNAMLYLDDIQHTDPEFLQKFISLCDGSRRIEGVWKGRTRTYDLRGKKFCVVMAGNPYTETGEKFRIPDMLANRADIYNLGDQLSGREHLFALSFIENAITSNTVLAPLATRDQQDIYRLCRMAQGEQIPATDLSHGYSAGELDEIVSTLSKLMQCRDVLLKVNAQYIESAAQDDALRSEPAFKLQGSYRNMAKLAEKIVPAMNADEVEALITDHYRGESQTLTVGAKGNLLKLKELRGRLSTEEAAEWSRIKEEFKALQRMGGSGDDPVARMTGAIGLLGDQMKGIRGALSETRDPALPARIAGLGGELGRIAEAMSAPGPVEPLLESLDKRLSELSEILSDGPLPRSVGAVGQAMERLAEGGEAGEIRSGLEGLAAAVESALAKAERSGDRTEPMALPVSASAIARQTEKVLVEEAGRLLQGKEPRPSADPTLAGALAAVQRLTGRITNRIVSEEMVDREMLMQGLREDVAMALAEIAEG
jgi:hypothetical protein